MLKNFNEFRKALVLLVAFAVTGCALLANPVDGTNSDNNAAELEDGGDEGFSAKTLASLTYRYPVAYYINSKTIFDNYPGWEGETPSAWSISPTLPAGLSISPTTGVISGTPGSTSGLTTYTVTATNSEGSQTTTIQIAVSNGFLVDSLGDGGAGGSNSDEDCDDGGGACTLRAAIEEASNSPSPPYTIMIPNGRYALAAGELAINQDVNIMGESELGVVITGLTASRAFNITGPSSAYIANLSTNATNGVLGGAISITGGALTLEHVSISNSGSFTNEGGAVNCSDSFGALPMDCTFRHTTFYNGVANNDFGGCLWFDGDTLTVEDSNFTGCRTNGGNGGGAIAISLDTAATISRSTFYRNVIESGGWGGAIYIRSSNSAPILIEDSTFLENEAVNGHGSAIHVYDQSNTTIRNCTFVRNMGEGGATVTSYNTADVTVENSTFFNNLGGWAAVNGNNGGNTTIQNNIFAGHLNASGDICSVAGGGGGTIVSGGGNVFYGSAAVCSPIGSDTVADPEVLGLGDWGGPVRTVRLASTSPAIDFANQSNCSNEDARGEDRSSGCDSGAFEYSENSGPTRINVPRTWYALRLNATMTSITPTVEGSVEGYSILPGLPTGVSLDPDTGVISGTPTVTQAGVMYTLYAKNQYGTTSTKFMLKVLKSFTVDSTLQAGAGGSTTDGVCDDGGGNCTFQAAIDEAEGMFGATGEEYMVYVPNGTYAFNSQLQVSERMTIVGESRLGTVLDPTIATTTLQVDQPVTVYISDLTMQDSFRGLHVSVAAARLFVSNIALQDFTVTAGNAAALLANGGTQIDIENSVIRRNITTAGGSTGGAIHQSTGGATLNIRKTVFDDNDSQDRGGAIRSQGNHLMIDTSYFANSDVQTQGGAIYSDARAFISNSAFETNTAVGAATQGGAVFLTSNKSSLIQNSTFEDNQAPRGSAMYGSGTGAVYFLSNTIANGTSSDNNFGAIFVANPNVYLFSNLFSNNMDGNPALLNCNVSAGSVVSLGNNMTDHATGADCNFTGIDYPGEASINLGAFTATDTTGYFPLAAGSAAIDASDGGCSVRDVRGQLRPIDYGNNGTYSCDIGSFEAKP